MAEHKVEVDYVEVKAEDIIDERRRLYDGFMFAAKIGVGVTVAALAGLYLFWG